MNDLFKGVLQGLLGALWDMVPHGLIAEGAAPLWVGVGRHGLAIFLVVLKLGISSFLQFLGYLVQPSQDALVTVTPEPS